MQFVAIFSKLAICILYGKDFELITQEPEVILTSTHLLTYMIC